jgi:ribosomal protein L12E/L44/L45/RPP1/RPP2
MAEQISRTYRNVTWKNIETKDALNCEIIVNLDNGSSQIFTAVVSKPNDGSINEDWEAIMEKFGADAIDEATTEAVQAKQAKREQDRIREEENAKRQSEFEKQEMLFAYKLEAFEIEAVKNSKDRATKALIRKSKSIPEVQAYTTILLMKELNNAEQQSAAEEPAVSEETPAEE